MDAEQRGVLAAGLAGFGTLGILTRLTFRLVPAKPFVHVTYETHATIAAYRAAIEGHIARGDVEFMDGIIHGPTQLVLSVAIVDATNATETIVAKQGDVECAVREILDQHGTRLHLVDVVAGAVDVRYSAQLRGTSPTSEPREIDNIRYLRQSRYCESDMLAPTARSQFGGLTGSQLVSAVSEWVTTQVRYVSGSSNSTDGALRTLISRKGVCRDFAHLGVSLCFAGNFRIARHQESSVHGTLNDCPREGIAILGTETNLVS